MYTEGTPVNRYKLLCTRYIIVRCTSYEYIVQGTSYYPSRATSSSLASCASCVPARERADTTFGVSFGTMYEHATYSYIVLVRVHRTYRTLSAVQYTIVHHVVVPVSHARTCSLHARIPVHRSPTMYDVRCTCTCTMYRHAYIHVRCTRTSYYYCLCVRYDVHRTSIYYVHTRTRYIVPCTAIV